MHNRCTEAMLELVTTFLTYSEKWLQDGIIDYATYQMITSEKKKFIQHIKKQG